MAFRVPLCLPWVGDFPSRPEERTVMATNDLDKNNETYEPPRQRSGASGLLIGALVLALAGNVYLLVRSSRLNDQISTLRDDTQAQLAKLDSSVAAQQSDYKGRFEAVNTSVSANNA